jgi:uncharacterized protein (TIGR02145 family)
MIDKIRLNFNKYIYYYFFLSTTFNNISFLFGQSNSITVKDIDGNIYKTVQIGNMIWTTENLKVTHYTNGDAIPNIIQSYEWPSLTIGAYCKYENNDSLVNIYGYLYNFHAIKDKRKISPPGWHVPTDDEFKDLMIFLGMSKIDADSIGMHGNNFGGKLKTSGTLNWEDPNIGATNESGFSALPSGYRLYDSNFEGIGSSCSFWTSSQYDSSTAWLRILLNIDSGIVRGHGPLENGASVRLIKNK